MLFVTVQLLQIIERVYCLRQRHILCISVCLYSVRARSCSLTVEVCQFFDIIPQVSGHGQGLSHLQVSFSDEERKMGKKQEEAEDGKTDTKRGRK